MKLIAEYQDQDIDVVVEDVIDEATGKSKGKSYNIEGVFAQAEQKNRNGRVYPKGIMESAVTKYIEEQVKSGRAVGELNHPDGPTINLDKVSHRITDLRFEGNDVVGKASILDTPCGKIVQGLLEGGVKLGVSTRGMGSLEQRESAMYVKEDFVLSTVDIVQDPSAPDAFVNGIMEGVDWVWNNGVLTAQAIEKIETEIKRTPVKSIAEARDTEIRAFKNFLSSL